MVVRLLTVDRVIYNGILPRVGRSKRVASTTGSGKGGSHLEQHLQVLSRPKHRAKVQKGYGFQVVFHCCESAVRQYQWTLLLIDFCHTLQTSESGASSKTRLENQRLKPRKSFVDVPKSQVVEKVRSCYGFSGHR